MIGGYFSCGPHVETVKLDSGGYEYRLHWDKKHYRLEKGEKGDAVLLPIDNNEKEYAGPRRKEAQK